MILLVVDTQKGCFDERLYAFETVRNNIKQLITIARENNVEGRRYAKIITIEQAIQLLQGDVDV